LILFDLNKFKPINDNFGHHEGDFALRQFAEAMRRAFRESDVIGRLGGDEFVAMLTGASEEQVSMVLDRFKNEVDAINKTINKPYTIAYSAGVAHFACDTEQSLEEMVAVADASMYESKNARVR